MVLVVVTELSLDLSKVGVSIVWAVVWVVLRSAVCLDWLSLSLTDGQEGGSREGRNDSEGSDHFE